MKRKWISIINKFVQVVTVTNWENLNVKNVMTYCVKMPQGTFQLKVTGTLVVTESFWEFSELFLEFLEIVSSASPWRVTCPLSGVL